MQHSTSFASSRSASSALPDGETSKIEEVTVYKVTGFFSVFAYIWFLIILMVSSPDVVEPWEAILTFLFFPILTGLAFAADKGWLDKCCRRSHRNHE